MIKRKRKLKRNPYIVDYGYHLTSSNYLDSILEKGLLPKNVIKVYNEQIDLYYNYQIPIFFFLEKSIDSIITQYNKEHLKSRDILLTVNINKFSQLPDIPSFLEDPSPFAISNREQKGIIIWDQIEFEDSPKYEYFRKYIKRKKFYGLSWTDIRNDEELQMMMILTTNTFCINERIPPKYIEEIIRL